MKYIKEHYAFICIMFWFILFLGGWTYTYNTDTPAGTDAPSVLDDRIREVKDALQERLNVEHVFDLTGSEVSHADTGKHTDITCDSVTSTGAISGTDITGTGDAVIGGTLDVTGNTTVGGTLDVTGAFESTGVATLADASLTKTSAAPTTDAMIANKKYVDDSKALSAKTTLDADSDSLAAGTTYTATSDGFVSFYSMKTPVAQLKATAVEGGETKVYRSISTGFTDHHLSDELSVASGDTFLITDNTGGATVVIKWRSIGTLSKPTKP